MEQLLQFSNKTEGRDKALKVAQYGCRFLKTLVKDPELLTRLNGLFAASRDARKMFRLFKSVHEYDTIVKAQLNPSLKPFPKLMTILSRAAFFVYWIFDNLGMFATIKLIKKDPKPLTKTAMTAWFVALVFTLINALKNLADCYSEELLSKDRSLTPAKTPSNKTTHYINLAKTLGDMLPAAAGSGIAEKLGIKINDRLAGLGGLVSGAIACYQAWPAGK
jgi:hypothetical protein